MSLQLTGLLSRLTPWPRPELPARAEAGGDAVSSACAAARDSLPPGYRVRFDALFDASRPDAAVRSEVLDRALATSRSVVGAEALAQEWERLPAEVRRCVHDPVAAMANHGRQSDATTCGSAVLTMVAAAGDPFLALWLATGRVITASPPTELDRAPQTALDALVRAPRSARFAVLHRVMKQRTNGGALLGLPWPRALGTPPWTAAKVARFLEVRFVPVMLDDTDRDRLQEVLDRVGAAVDVAVPVPLYTGGDTSRGWAAALPRHVVLATRRTTDGFAIWEPASGRLHDVARKQLYGSSGPVKALGGWSHLSWALLPDL